MIPLLLTLGALLPHAAPQSSVQTPSPTLVRVCVQTDDTGDPSELAARRESVKDLASVLASKKRSLTIVEDEDAADVIVEVLDRGLIVPRVVLGMGAKPGQPPGADGLGRTVVLRVQLLFRDEPFRFTNKNKPADVPGGWKSAATDIGDQIEKWIAARRAEITKR